MTKPRIWTPKDVMKKAQTYMSPAEVSKVELAYQFANKAHRGQYRKSGDKYISHPTQVAYILAGLKMDEETVCSGFLHDVVQDTPVTLKQVKAKFGDTIALIVYGVTKLDKIKYHPHKNKKLTINFRRLLLAICPDIRSMIVKLADRLHNMETLRYLPAAKQKTTSRETFDVYAPLADRLGIGAIKWRLQDLCLKYLKPEAYHKIASHLSFKRTQRNEYINSAIKQVRGFIKNLHLHHPLLYGRPKHIYSIYHKITVRHKSFDQIFDFLAMRVIVDKVSQCYAVLSAIETHWLPMPGRFKDYIANPKPNGYRSLHITVIGPKKRPFEIQIRTRKMHHIAEYGVAAHWAYKAGIKGKVHTNNNNSQLNWFKRMIAVQESKANQPVYNLKSDLFSNHVYVFTPNGDVLELPKGAGPLDVAYQIHTEVGNHAMGAKVNGKIVPLDCHLHNGDTVAIMTSTKATPSRDWYRIIKSRNAKRKIRQYFKQHDHDENVAEGRNQVLRSLRDHKYPANLINSDQIEEIANRRNFNSTEDLLAAVGYGAVGVNSIVNNLGRYVKEQRAKQDRLDEEKRIQNAANSSNKKVVLSQRPHQLEPADTTKKSFQGIVIGGINNVLVRLSHCCYPVPGDPIVGYITHGNGISIHRRDCPHIADDKSQQRLVVAHWSNSNQTSTYYATKLSIDAYDRGNLVKDIIQVGSEKAGQIISFSGGYDTQTDVTMHLKIEVHNLKQLKDLMTGLQSISKVRKVTREMSK